MSVCGATETLLVDREGAERLLPPIAEALAAAGCELRGDAEARRIWPEMGEASDADWRTEYLAPILAVRTVEGVEGAAETGFAVGYDSPSQFSREYARQFGLPPGRDAARMRESLMMG